MADISLVVEVQGAKDIIAINNSLKRVEGNVKTLATAMESGKVSNKAYTLGLAQQIAALTKLGHSKSEALKAVKGLADSQRKSTQESKASKAAADLEAAATKKATEELKAYRLARMQANEANVRFNREQALAAQAARSAAAATKALSDRHMELRMRFQEGYAQFTRQREALRSLREAYRAQIITLEEYKRQAQLLRTINQGNVAGTNSLGVAMQQTGYQVGDFLVQVQGGTNPLVAFGQQATQLVGILPLIASNLGLTTMAAIGLSSALGIGIPLVTAIGAAYMMSGGAAKTLEDALSDLSDAGSNIADVFAVLDDDSLEETYGSLAGVVRDLSSSFVELNRAAEVKALLAVLETLEKKANAGWWDKIKTTGSTAATFGASLGAVIATGAASWETASEKKFGNLGFSMGRDVFNNLVSGMESAAKSGDTEKVLRLFDDLVKDATDNGLTSGMVTSEGVDLLNQMRAALVGVAESYAVLNGEAKSFSEGNDGLEDRVKAEEKIADIVQGYLYKEIEARAKLLEAGGKDAEALQLRMETAYKRAEAEVLAEAAIKGQSLLVGDSAKKAGEAAAEAVRLASETDKAKDAASGFASAMRDAASAMNSLSNLGTTISKGLAVATAKVAALKAGANAAVAASITGSRFDVQNRLSAVENSGASASTKMLARIQAGFQNTQLDKTEALLNEEAMLVEAKKGGGTPSGRIDTQEEYLAKLVRESELKRESIGLSDEQVKKAEYIFAMDEKIATMKTTQSEVEIEALRKQAIAAYDLAVAAEKQQQIVDQVETSVENAFMALIDGSKSVEDAFKGMVREILLEVYRSAVAKPIGEAIGELFGGFMADGGVFSGGSQVKAFATGGVVGDPTFFPMSGGKTGLMGEAGPEAIMPLKRGSNGKLGVQMEGGGGSVVVHQSFNFQANGDESVKKLIAQAAPKIAQMTKSSLIDDRRRGGQVKNAFG